MPAAFTLRWYQQLPLLHRSYDTAAELLGFLDAFGIELQEVEDLLDRIQKTYPGEPGYVAGDTSDLVDPTAAPGEWLAWQAMLYGQRLERPLGPESFAGTYGQLSADYATYADLSAAAATYADLAELTTPPEAGLTEAEQRALIADRPGWRAGSTGAIREAVQRFLIGDRSVMFERGFGGDPNVVRITTYEAETPYPWKIEQLVATRGFAPAHVELVYEAIAGATYAELSADFATYGDLLVAFADYEEMSHHLP